MQKNRTPQYLLTDEVAELRRLIAELEAREAIHKRIEAELRTREERYSMAVTAGKVGVWDWNLETNEIYLDPILKSMLGYEDHEIANQIEVWGKYVHPEDSEQVMIVAQAHLEGKTPHYEIEHRMLHKDGSVRWYLARGKAVRDNTGKPYRMVGTDTDITGSKEMEMALQHTHDELEQRVEERTVQLRQTNEQLQQEIRERIRAEEDLRSVMDAIPDYLWSADVDAEGNLTYRYYSHGVERITGRPPQFFTEGPHRWLSTIHPEDRPRLEQVVQRLLARRSGQEETEYRILRPDDETRWVRDHATVTPLGNGGIRLNGVVSDITHRKRMEQDWIQLERIRALGKMAEGVAHNFNNLLVGVLGYAQLIQMKSEDPEIFGDAQGIVDSAMRAKELVHRLNLATSGREPGKSSIPIREAVETAIAATRPHWKDEPESRGVSITTTVHLQDCPPAVGTISGLQDILTHLILNAVDAMPEGGTITIATQTVDGHVQVSVTDTGTGMSAQTRERAFEPFFTTKATVGSGLGLSVVRGIITGWGGTVALDSTPGRGTTVSLRLPIWQVEESQETPATSQTRSGHILIVDDDEEVRQVLPQILENQHRVDIASSGAEALEQATAETYDIAIIDLGMPGIPGNQVARELRKKNPALVTVLVTGWNLQDDDPRLAGFDFRIEKPFKIHQLRGVIQQAIDLCDQRARPLE